MIAAWYAVHRSASTPARYLDLGCGIGSVLLMVTHKVRPPVARGVEAQAQSVMMARRAVSELPSHQSEIEVHHADFRDLIENDGLYDLITGSPPYFPTGTGVLPADAQRRACRFEERGGVEAYAGAAARLMTTSGRFYVVFQTRGSARVMAAAHAHGLHLGGRADFHARAQDVAPFLTVFEFSRTPSQPLHRFACAVRDVDGAVSFSYERIRRELGVSATPR